MTRAADKAYRWRWAILVVGLLATAAGAVFFLIPTMVGMMGPWGTPLIIPIIGASDEAGIAASGAITLGIGLITQWLFLRPRRGISLRLTKAGRPLRLSMAAAGLMAALLTTGLIATLLEIPNWWNKLPESALVWVWVTMAVLWLAWAVIFMIYWKAGDEYTRLTRIIRGLVAGSVLEMLVAAPVQAMTYSRAQHDCYCTRGSYTGLVLGGTVLVWAFGPGIVLLFLREKHRRERLMQGWSPEFCAECGYDLRGTTAAGRTACPECGREFGAETAKA
ncbi:MAG: hypothetical protein NTW19_20120 [Planctomycetota bacterium]|nr:hypothetical protein [Planctomycetota bacterium]